MKSHPLSSILASFLIISLLAPSAFLASPRVVDAQVQGFEEYEVPTGDWLTRLKETLNLVSTYTNTAANVAQQVNAYVLQPLAFVLSGNLMKLLTASVLDFVIGKTNGTGAPQFVQNVSGMMQRVGDIQANAFFVQFGRNSNSPFSAAIVSSLRTNYLWNTSSAGFFAANQSTLGRYSPNTGAFLSGNWSQGGIGAWFALTTQTRNNPYTLYQASQSHLSGLVQGAQEARAAILNWGQGFMSWCGANEDATVSTDALYDDPSVSGIGSAGINPGDPCYMSDGTPGTTKTPGSTIKAALDKVLGGTQDKLAQLGSLANEVNGILGNVGTVLSTVQFASQLLGGPGSGGLFGVGQTSGTNNTSRILQYQAPGYLGVTQGTVVQNARTIQSTGSDISGRIDQYASAWATIRAATVSASTTVASLATVCEAAATSGSQYTDYLTASAAQATAAHAAISTVIAPIIAQANAADAVVASARAMVARVQQGSASASTTGSSYVTDLQALQNMPPSDSDISSAMQDAQALGGSAAIPPGSLTVSGGTIVARMRLLAANAEALKTSVCVESLYVPVSGNGNNNTSGQND